MPSTYQGAAPCKDLPVLYPDGVNYRIRLIETDEGWSVSCLDLPGCHSQGESREAALENIREAIALWLEVEAEESGIKSTETLVVAF
jgi:predicted RNase H-like HicB family nuclease